MARRSDVVVQVRRATSTPRLVGMTAGGVAELGTVAAVKAGAGGAADMRSMAVAAATMMSDGHRDVMVRYLCRISMEFGHV